MLSALGGILIIIASRRNVIHFASIRRAAKIIGDRQCLRHPLNRIGRLTPMRDIETAGEGSTKPVMRHANIDGDRHWQCQQRS